MSLSELLRKLSRRSCQSFVCTTKRRTKREIERRRQIFDQTRPHHGDGPFAYTVRVLDRDGNKVYEVNTPINDVWNRVQQFVIDEYLEIVQPKKWAFKKEGNDE